MYSPSVLRHKGYHVRDANLHPDQFAAEPRAVSSEIYLVKDSDCSIIVYNFSVFIWIFYCGY